MRINRRMGKLWYSHKMEHYIVIKKSKVLIPAMLWINLKDTLSERRQTQKSTYKVQVEAKLIYGNRSKIAVYLCGVGTD